MKFNHLPADVIAIIYNNLELDVAYLQLCHAACLAANEYNLHLKVKYVNGARFDISSDVQMKNYTRMRNRYPKLKRTIFITDWLDDVQCYCYEPKNSVFSEIIYYLYQGRTLEEIQNRLIKSKKNHFGVGLFSTLILKLFIHFANEEHITEEMKQTSYYN